MPDYHRRNDPVPLVHCGKLRDHGQGSSPRLTERSPTAAEPTVQTPSSASAPSARHGSIEHRTDTRASAAGQKTRLSHKLLYCEAATKPEDRRNTGREAEAKYPVRHSALAVEGFSPPHSQAPPPSAACECSAVQRSAGGHCRRGPVRPRTGMQRGPTAQASLHFV